MAVFGQEKSAVTVQCRIRETLLESGGTECRNVRECGVHGHEE